MFINLDITYLPGVGTQRAMLLASDMNIHTADELVELFPYKYIDRSRIYTISQIQPNMAYVQLKGRFIHIGTKGEGRTKRLCAVFTDGTGTIETVWFAGINYMLKVLNITQEFMLFGKPTIFNGIYNISHPEIEPADKSILNAGTLQPFYNTSERMKRAGMTNNVMLKIMHGLLDKVNTPFPETLPPYITQKYKLISRDSAIRKLHQPDTIRDIENAQFRFKFEELFYIQLGILRTRNHNKQAIRGVKFCNAGSLLSRFYKECIPFEPTDAQKRVVHEVWNDMCSGRQMNRLVQGDVGSGKTLVALMVMLLTVGNNMQACMMAPTEILATQHYASLKSMLGNMPVRVELLTGSTRKKDRETIHNGLMDGSINILVGTHALIEDSVQFKSLALAVVDEQHRFGVSQRSKLWAKAAIPPHVLVMTATPIPRTLAMTVYGDLDVSIIDQLPPGRKPISTYHYYYSNRNSVNQFILRELQKGRQIYVVCPLIEENEKLDYQNLNNMYSYLVETFSSYNVCMVHGKMKPKDKDAAMQLFAEGNAQIMVATTVIEVGVNVPNASVMIIESAERFGLSQLHQLRGRVGRGADQSYCILLTDTKLAKETLQRMQIMVESTDGFRIAEADMQLRGPGNIDGTQQSGLPFALKMADLSKDASLVQYTRDIAEQILSADPTLQTPQNAILLHRLNDLQKETLNWSLIS